MDETPDDSDPEVGSPTVVIPPEESRMERLPLSDDACAAELGISKEELLRGRAAAARELYERGQAYVDALAAAKALVAEAKAGLVDAVGSAYYEWGMGYEMISQNTGSVRLDDDGKRIGGTPDKGAITPTTAKRWITEVGSDRHTASAA